ncbi:MAG: hypothetical protein NC388_09850 [Clostridium sp.]|nr:hypothetical protein [Clostridium sp.]
MCELNGFYKRIVKSFNVYNGFHARLLESPRYVLLPRTETEEQTVEFNTRMEGLLWLHRMAAVDSATAGRAIAATMLFHAYMQKNLYVRAEDALAEMEKHLPRLYRTAQAEDIGRVDDGIGLQMGFLLGHELGHICYACRPELLDADTAAMSRTIDRDLQIVDKIMGTWKQRLLCMVMPGVARKNIRSLEKAKADAELLEEMVCDYRAWTMMREILECHTGGEELARLCAQVALTLNTLEVHQAIEVFYLPPDAEQLDFEMGFNSARQLVIGQVIWEWLYHEHSPRLAHHYQTFIRRYGRHDRWSIIKAALMDLLSHPDIRRPRAPYDSSEAERLDLQYRQLMGA